MKGSVPVSFPCLKKPSSSSAGRDIGPQQHRRGAARPQHPPQVADPQPPPRWLKRRSCSSSVVLLPKKRSSWCEGEQGICLPPLPPPGDPGWAGVTRGSAELLLALGEPQGHARSASVPLHRPPPAPAPGLSQSPGSGPGALLVWRWQAQETPPCPSQENSAFLPSGTFLPRSSQVFYKGLEAGAQTPANPVQAFFSPLQCLLCKDSACSARGSPATGGRWPMESIGACQAGQEPALRRTPRTLDTRRRCHSLG